jgi:hypothetical protein
MEPPNTGVTDVHGGAFSDGGNALQNGNMICSVSLGIRVQSLVFILGHMSPFSLQIVKNTLYRNAATQAIKKGVKKAENRRKTHFLSGCGAVFQPLENASLKVPVFGKKEPAKRGKHQCSAGIISTGILDRSRAHSLMSPTDVLQFAPPCPCAPIMIISALSSRALSGIAL